jgi:hypothetical protein
VWTIAIIRQMQRVEQRGMELVGDVRLQSHLPGETRHHVRLVRMPADSDSFDGGFNTSAV